MTDFYTPEIESPFVSAELLLDTLDSVNFPTKGYRFALQGQRIFDTDGPGYKNIYEASACVPFTHGRWTTLLSGKIGRSAMPSVFSLGGAFELTGSPYGRWTGSDIQLGTVRVSRNISDWFGAGRANGLARRFGRSGPRLQPGGGGRLGRSGLAPRLGRIRGRRQPDRPHLSDGRPHDGRGLGLLLLLGPQDVVRRPSSGLIRLEGRDRAAGECD